MRAQPTISAALYGAAIIIFKKNLIFLIFKTNVNQGYYHRPL